MAVSAMAAIGLAVALSAAGVAVAAMAGTPVELPHAACNAGTETAHASIPATIETGDATPGHIHVPALNETGACVTGAESA